MFFLFNKKFTVGASPAVFSAQKKKDHEQDPKHVPDTIAAGGSKKPRTIRVAAAAAPPGVAIEG